ncbi:conserved Plasmodium protein, unknown function [Plasmodium ovale curtisi]|uniref:Uncharacterized protein n=1 Tax=Plasmodium ovale curtisi TaxID=864141 RepID=A0A1A8W450_PLAOA|nr:conserved Plasmodium protein, unknown function [Plasmodium ovale curtisi]SBS96228.1 conserved Plasmodium protein, unknown function [Plasmodium ovale curtisi]
MSESVRNMNSTMRKSLIPFFMFKSSVKTLTKGSQNGDYEIIRTVIHKEKEKKFGNIFFCVGLINIASFLLTVQNYYRKMEDDYYCHNDINIVDHILLSEVANCVGVNNLPVYLKNKFYNKLVSNIQEENYSFKENAFLGLLEYFYKNKYSFSEIEKSYKKEHADILTYIFKKVQNENLEYTKKKIYSCILFYYIKYSNNLFLTYDQIYQLVFNRNLFHNLNEREEIISYLLLKIFKNDECISQLYEREKVLFQIPSLGKGDDGTDESGDINSDIALERGREFVMHFLLSPKGEDKHREDQSIWKFYFDIKKNNENYYKEKCLLLIENHCNKIHIPFFFEKNDTIIKKKKNYNDVMNKIYMKYFENTILYTFIFSFTLHNINAKEYTLKNYFRITKDICRSIYINCLINSFFLVEKSIMLTQNGNGDDCSFLLRSLLFNLLNSLSFSFCLYRCKYGTNKRGNTSARTCDTTINMLLTTTFFSNTFVLSIACFNKTSAKTNNGGDFPN